MITDYSPRYVYMAIAIAVLFVSPILLLLLPSFIANSIHHTPGSWHVITPKEGYITYAVAFLLLFLAPLALFIFDINKKSVIAGLVFLILSGVFFFLASYHYVSIGSQSIMYREGYFNENYQYSWEDIQRVKYERVPRDEGFSTYYITFKSEEELLLKENGIVQDYRRAIIKKLTENSIDIE